MKKKGNWAICEDYTDDLRSHVMLYRMMAIQTEADIFLDNGNPYAVRPHDYWEKAIRSSRSTAQRTLNKLRKSKIIETVRVKVFGEVRLHIRLATKFTEKHGVNVQNDPSIGSICDNGTGQNDTTGQVKMTQSYISKKDSVKDNVKQSATKIRKEILGTSKTVLENKKPTFDNARKVWSVYWHKYQDGPVDGFPQSPKVRKMYRDWVSKIPKDQSPLYLIARAVQHWSEFRDEVKTDTGKPIPDYPSLVHVIWNLPPLLRISPHIGEPAKSSPASSDAPLNATQKMKLKILQEAEGHPKSITKGIWQK